LGDHIYVVADRDRGARWDLTKDAVRAALDKRWPGKVTVYDEDDDQFGKALGFMVELRDTPWKEFVSWDGTFREDAQSLAVSFGEPGAMIVEWFMELIPENVPCLTFTEEDNDPIPLPPRPTAKQVLELTGWDRRVKKP
jgi:hypothetical protein